LLAKSKLDKAPASPFSRHRSRYFRYRRENVPIEEIAKADGVGIRVVRQSIAFMSDYYELNTEEELKTATIELIRSISKLEKKAIEDALVATKPIHDEESGDILRIEPDHAVRLEAIAVNTKRIEALLAKRGGFGTQVNLGVGVNVNQSGGVTQGGTFENRLREIQQKRDEFLLNPPEPEEVEAEYEEGDEVIIEANPDDAQPNEVLNVNKS
jgi:hypothetical protein